MALRGAGSRRGGGGDIGIHRSAKRREECTSTGKTFMLGDMEEMQGFAVDRELDQQKM